MAVQEGCRGNVSDGDIGWTIEDNMDSNRGRNCGQRDHDEATCCRNRALTDQPSDSHSVEMGGAEREWAVGGLAGLSDLADSSAVVGFEGPQPDFPHDDNDDIGGCRCSKSEINSGRRKKSLT
jgi:hypothetical protein